MPPKKGPSNKNASGTSTPIVPDTDYIVFGDGKKRKGKGKEQSASEPTEPSKPTARQVIGGASWTGKLPVNLLSEHCQKQKWNKPDYDMRTVPAPDGNGKTYRSSVRLSKTDPKTREVTQLPAMQLPSSHVQLSGQDTALEARHFAATYALFRVSSMKQIHMMLPPQYRDLWKGEFVDLKKQDEKEGRAWKYDADPFAAEDKRKEIHVAMEKRQEQAKQREADPQNVKRSIVPMKRSRAWERAPRIDLGSKMRSEMEALVRQNVVWNPHRLELSQQERMKIIAGMVKLGFRRGHVEEAVLYCKDREEVLEWLLVHVPEDDLPPFALPAHYSTGVSLASGDLVREAKLKRLAASGYARDLCAQALRDANNDEQSAAFLLQSSILTDGTVSPNPPNAGEADRVGGTVWEEEMTSLQAILDEKITLSGQGECTVSIEGFDPQVSLRVICPPHYPNEVPAILLEAEKLPAHIRLGAIKKVLVYIKDQCLGDMMVYNIQGWLESNLPQLKENPAPLMELTPRALTESLEATDSEIDVKGNGKRSSNRVRNPRNDTRSNQQILDFWSKRQKSVAQEKMIASRQTLPAWSKQEAIVNSINNKSVTIVSGETGSGKSTQAVQFVLDSAIKGLKGSRTNIICTQPRRVAALSLADRVSSERCSDAGDEVGYVIRGESKTSSNTKITFMTTGVLLRRLQSSSGGSKDGLEGTSHVFVDEVHERSLDTDFLLTLLRERMTRHPNLRIVLMSATLDAGTFSDYFGGLSQVNHVHIEGRTFPVTDYYLDDVLKTIRPNLGTCDNDDNDDDFNTGKAIQSLGTGINYDVIRDLILHMDRDLGSRSGSILVFLPGTMEIDRCLRSMAQYSHIYALPLHASLLPSEQRRVFQSAPRGKRKVIAATNVAETSITIEDVVAVVDTGRVKETSYDVGNNVVRLTETWASKAACKQRRGRAGRVRAGNCYKLFTRNNEAKMADKPLPEIQRTPLEQLCLSVKATGGADDGDRDVEVFLDSTISPPDSKAVKSALHKLHEMGVLSDNRLTALGTYMSMIPADLRCAKLLIYGTLFQCLEPCLTLAAILTVRSPFMSPPDKREESKAARNSFNTTASGDLLLDLEAYKQYSLISRGESRSEKREFQPRELQTWCREKFLSLQTFRDIDSTRSQLLDSLKDARLVPLDYRFVPPPSSLPSSLGLPAAATARAKEGKGIEESPFLLRALISAALQPQIAEISFPDKKYIQSQSGAKELDPEARTIKYFAPVSPVSPISTSDFITTTSSSSSFNLSSTPHLHLQIHPQSRNHSQASSSKGSTRSSTPAPGSTPALVPGSGSSPTTAASSIHDASPNNNNNNNSMERVFVHPSSTLFDAQSFTGAARYVSYFTKLATAKVYIRDLTPLNPYSLLLFGGAIEVDTGDGAGGREGGLVVGGTFKLRGWARIGVLVSRLRWLLDQELQTALESEEVLLSVMTSDQTTAQRGTGNGNGNGNGNGKGTNKFGQSRVVSLVKSLVELNGQDQ